MNNTIRLSVLALAIIGLVVATGCQTAEKETSYTRSTYQPKATPPPTTTATPPAPKRTESGGNISVSYSYPTGSPETSVVQVEKVSPKRVNVGRPYTYKLHVRNLADCELTDVAVTDRLPEKFEIQSATPQPRNVEGREVTWVIGTISKGGSETISVTGVARGQGSITGCAKVVYRTPLCLTVIAVDPQLSLTKTAPSEVLVCDPIPVRYVVTNAGTGTAEKVVVRDTLPAGLTTADGKQTVGFDAGDLEQGESREFTVTLKASKTGSFGSKAVATGSEGLKASADASTTVRKPVLFITKTGPKQTFIGRQITYNIRVENKGDTASKETTIQDAVPTGTTFQSASNGGQEANGVVTWSLGSLAPGASKEVSVTLRAGKDITTARNVASASGVCADQVTASAQTKIIGVPAVLLEVVDLEDPVVVGEETTYLIRATNQGSAPGTNLKITAQFEDTSEHVSSSGATKATVKGRTITFAPLATLAPKAKATWRVTVRAKESGDVRFSVSLTSDQIGRPVQETEATNYYK